MDHAISKYRDAYIVTLSAGTTHKPPPLDVNGYPIFESVAAAHYLMRHGILPERILIETSSYDTIGNAYFSRMIHIDPLSLKKLLIVTSEFHMPRTQVIFEWVYHLEGLPQDYDLEFHLVNDEGIDAYLLAARRAREGKSLENVRSLTQKNDTTISCLVVSRTWCLCHGSTSCKDLGECVRELLKKSIAALSLNQ